MDAAAQIRRGYLGRDPPGIGVAIGADLVGKIHREADGDHAHQTQEQNGNKDPCSYHYLNLSLERTATLKAVIISLCSCFQC